MLLVIKEGRVFATHNDDQASQIKDVYGALEIIQVADNTQLFALDGNPTGLALDPRIDAEGNPTGIAWTNAKAAPTPMERLTALEDAMLVLL